MTYYAYRIYKNFNLANPVIGGTVSANNMDEAFIKACKQNDVTVKKEEGEYYDNYTFMREGVKIGVIVYGLPEQLYKEF